MTDRPVSIGNRSITAAGAAVTANLILGASSLYWKLLSAVPAMTLLGYRIFMSLLTLAAISVWSGRLRSLRARATRQILLIHAAAATLVVINWGTFILASIHGYVVESGLGYLIAPFVAIGVGALSDGLSRLRAAALFVITSAVGVLLLASGELQHWVYLVIGATWGTYACLKKATSLDAFSGLLCETIVLTVLLGVATCISPLTLRLPDGLSALALLNLGLCGFVSTIPLGLFSFAASRLPLSVMGFFQFVLPSTQLVVALLVYRQPLGLISAACFCVIWLALLITLAEPLVPRLMHSAAGAAPVKKASLGKELI
jgi:chloramphenicol-sensitive protein RarD